MAGYFERAGGEDGGAAVALDEIEISILRSLAVQLLELIGPGERAESVGDELDALFTEGPSEPPSDPALARLFPDAITAPRTVIRTSAPSSTPPSSAGSPRVICAPENGKTCSG